MINRQNSTSWWCKPASERGRSLWCSSPKLLSNMMYLLAQLLSEYSWVLALVSDWLKRFGNPLSASTKIWQKRHLFPRLYYSRRNTTFYYLHCTSRLALALTVTFNPFSAKHQYFPEWFPLALKLIVSPWATVFPSLIHVIFGVGLPVALHCNLSSSFSTIIWSDGLVDKLGGTTWNDDKWMNEWGYINYIRIQNKCAFS